MKDYIGSLDWERTRKDIFWGEIAPCEHVLQVYDNDEVFLDTLKSFVTAGLRAGDAVVVIATREHLKSLNQGLKNQGFDLFTLTLEDQFIALNVEETLSQFMIKGWPDENLFCHVLTNVLARARKKNRQVRAFGEMVALLWSQGFSGATVHLEHLWSRFCASEAFSLFCAYPKSGFTADANDSLSKICKCHSKMIAGFRQQGDELLVQNVHAPQKMAS
ncbi:MAG TPA: MEDS domain-containing protein [Chryseosolibacter sp.]|nr:MEDS domain-containing protein [Chryseosolibacter sp.]